MQAGMGDNRNPVHRTDRRYAPDKPKECKHCYFWNGKRKGCSQKECYYLLPEDGKEPGEAQGNLSMPESGENGNCLGCPYGRHSPCIGYCLRKIMREMSEQKQAAGKEGNGIAG